MARWARHSGTILLPGIGTCEIYTFSLSCFLCRFFALTTDIKWPKNASLATDERQPHAAKSPTTASILHHPASRIMSKRGHTLWDVYQAAKTERHFDYWFWSSVVFSIVIDNVHPLLGRLLVSTAAALIFTIGLSGFLIVLPTVAEPWTVWFNFNIVWGTCHWPPLPPSPLTRSASYHHQVRFCCSASSSTTFPRSVRPRARRRTRPAATSHTRRTRRSGTKTTTDGSARNASDPSPRARTTAQCASAAC